MGNFQNDVESPSSDQQDLQNNRAELANKFREVYHHSNQRPGENPSGGDDEDAEQDIESGEINQQKSPNDGPASDLPSERGESYGDAHGPNDGKAPDESNFKSLDPYDGIEFPDFQAQQNPGIG